MVEGGAVAAEIKVVGFDASDSIDLTSFGDDLQLLLMWIRVMLK